MTGHRQSQRPAWWRRALKSLSVPALGMAVMMVAGGAAVSTAGRGTVNVELPPVPARPSVFTTPTPASRPVPPRMPAPVRAAVTTTVIAAVVPAPADQTWVVQVAAFSSQERSVVMVKHLADQGWPAYQVDPDGQHAWAHAGAGGALPIGGRGRCRARETASDAGLRGRVRPEHHEVVSSRNVASPAFVSTPSHATHACAAN